MLPSKEDMKARFWALFDATDAVRAKVAPLREARDKFVNDAAAKDVEMMGAIRTIEAKVEPGLSLFDAQQEMAFLARGLGNNVGPRPGPEAA